METNKPFSYAPITIVEGEQGSGKSNTAVSRAVDATFAEMTSVKLANGTVVKAEPVLTEKGFPIIGIGKLWIPNSKPRIMKIPPKSCVYSENIRVFANFHLHGIRAVYLPLPSIIEYLNSGLIKDAYLIIDEGYIGGNAREGMSNLTKVLIKLGMQIRKRHLHFIICTPNSRQLDWLFRDIETEHIVCDYDENTKNITLSIRNRKKYKQLRSVTYYAPQYWKYYDTDEQFAIPENQIAKALMGVI